MIYDLIIIGGGAGAAGAGVYAARRNLKFKLISRAWGGEMALSGEIGNYPGFVKINGIKLAEKFREQLKVNRAEIEEGVRVKQIIDKKSYLELSTSSDTYQTKTALITTGARPRKLNIPGEKKFKGKGVTYCTTCDGPLFRDREVAVVGGGNTALEAGLMMAGMAKKVSMVNLNREFTGEESLLKNLAKKKNVDFFYQTETKEILGEETVEGINVRNLKTHRTQIIKVQGVMIHIGVIPNSELTDVKKNRFGEIMVNQVGQTSHSRIWAAGDVTDHPYKQIAIASGQGISALLSIVEFLNKER
jgi:alkyl hydroperoxide reductase subunit F